MVDAFCLCEGPLSSHELGMSETAEWTTLLDNMVQLIYLW